MESFQRIELVTPDGVRLAVHDRPGPSPEAPVLFLSNGLGGNLPAWRHLVAHFGATHRIVSWDYRGLYGSAFTPDQRTRHIPLDVAAHAGDAIAVLDRLGITRAVFIGWSMGVQLNFELARLVRPRIEAIVAMNGTYGRPLHTTVFGRVGPRIIPHGMEGMRLGLVALRSLVRRAAEFPVVLATAKRLGVVADTLDEAVFRDLVREYVLLDFTTYNKILYALGRHDCESVLAGLDVPVLVIAGGRDPMTPHWLSKRMVELLPDAELAEFPKGTHYVPVEFPREVNARLERFLRDKVGHLGAEGREATG